MTDDKRPKRRGRPPLPESERKSGSNLTFRARSGLRELLAEEAKKADRSISEEIERRLERSFEEKDILENILDFYFGSKDTIALLKEMAPYINYQLARSRKSWRNDKATRDAIREHLSALFDALDDEKAFAESTAAYEAMIEHNKNAWRNPGPSGSLTPSAFGPEDENEATRALASNRHPTSGNAPESSSVLAGLSSQEIQILHCLIRGDSNKQISQELGITQTALKTHVESAMRKLRVKNLIEATSWASEHL
jgi:DNA-binding NarL/FixJ family response regulator